MTVLKLALLALNVLGAGATALLLVHIKVKVNSVLLHYAVHGLLLRNRRTGRIVAEILSAMVLCTPFDEYLRVHTGHHRHDFGITDKEARHLFDLGLRPGVRRDDLWRQFWKVLWSPSFHAEQTWTRLKMNFASGPAWRRVFVWAFWGGIVTFATAAGLLGAFLIGVMVPLLIGGNHGSLVELVSRHRWMITPKSDGRHRQDELSHGRFPAPEIPPQGSPWMAYMSWIGSIFVAIITRLVVPADLAWHHAHHDGVKPDKARLAQSLWSKLPVWRGAKESVLKANPRPTPAWCDAATAFSYSLEGENAAASRNYPSIAQTIDQWFGDLAAEKKLSLPLDGRCR